MSRSFAVAVDLSSIIPADGMTKEAFPNLAYAVERLTLAGHAQWTGYAQGEALPDGRVIRNATGAYLRSILHQMKGDFEGEVYSDLPYAEVIEDGAAAYDMKRILGFSLKVRVIQHGKRKGERYLIIPFRHDAPNTVIGRGMPQAVWDWWKGDRTSSHVTAIGERQSGTGAFDIKTRAPLMVPARRYVWGTRLSKADALGLGLSKEQARRVAGMVRFRKPDGAPGHGQHTQHITFRIMAESSKGWIRPARQGYHPAQHTADKIRPVAEQAFPKAVEADLAAHLGGTRED